MEEGGWKQEDGRRRMVIRIGKIEGRRKKEDERS